MARLQLEDEQCEKQRLAHWLDLAMVLLLEVLQNMSVCRCVDISCDFRSADLIYAIVCSFVGNGEVTDGFRCPRRNRCSFNYLHSIQLASDGRSDIEAFKIE